MYELTASFLPCSFNKSSQESLKEILERLLLFPSPHLQSLMEELMSINTTSCRAHTVHTELICSSVLSPRKGKKKKCWLDPNTVSLIISCSRLVAAGGRRLGQDLIWVGQGALANRNMSLLCGEVAALVWHECVAICELQPLLPVKDLKRHEWICRIFPAGWIHTHILG